MSARVIQGWFLGGQPKLTALVQPKMMAPPPIQTKAAPRPPGPPVPAFAGRLVAQIQTKTATRQPGPPAPAFAGRAAAVQRHGAGGPFQVDPSRLGLVNGSGKSLPDAVRGKMEAALGADFSNVRVHTGPQAERIGAIAFTTGNDIYFAPGRYQPNTLQGQQLLGHELTHVVQQRAGRVRNPLGSGLAVVYDRALEAEADRIGRLAVAQASRQFIHRAALRLGPSPRMGSRSWDTQGQAFRKTGPIQRTIWRQRHGMWVRKEVGTEGTRRPGEPEWETEGWYFNDITGKYGPTIDDVREGLADLAIVTGSLRDLKGDCSWPDDLWVDLNEAAIKKAGGDPRKTQIVNVGRVTLSSSGQAASFKLDQNDREYVHQRLLRRTWNDFLGRFMEANGQLPYLKRQEWFKKNLAWVVVDINFYYNRPPNEGFRFHKDTGGDNLFVNLIFNNKEPQLATEWIEDFGWDAKKKRKALRVNLPDAERANIRDARTGFANRTYRLEGRGTVRGGVSAGPATFVSWVDELVWHSTPAPISRTGYYKNILTPENYWRYKPYAVEAIRRLWDGGKLDEIGTFDRFTDDNNVEYLSQVTPELCDAYMNTVQTEAGKRGPNFDAHSSEIAALAKYRLKDLQDPDKPIALKKGVDLDADPAAMTDQMENQLKATPVAKVSRRNSASLGDFKISNEQRSFIRTWVRVHRHETRVGAGHYERDAIRNREALDLAVAPTLSRDNGFVHHADAGTLFATRLPAPLRR